MMDSTYSDVKAEQITDHSRHSRQDDNFGDVVDQRVHRQTQESERSIQLLGGKKSGFLFVTREMSKLTGMYVCI